MVNVLNVAEKPSVARSLADVFSRSQGATMGNTQGLLPQRNSNAGVPLMKIDNVCFPNVMNPNSRQEVPHNMIVTSVRGHLSNIDFAGNFRSWGGCSPGQLFSAPLEVNVDDDKKPLENMLKNLARQCQALILWLDCDREGIVIILCIVFILYYPYLGMDICLIIIKSFIVLLSSTT